MAGTKAKAAAPVHAAMAAAADVQAALARKLQEHGERFMAMFDEDGPPKKRQKVQAQKNAAAAQQQLSPSVPMKAANTPGRSALAGPRPGPPQALPSQPPTAASGRGAGGKPGSAPYRAQGRPLDEIDAIMGGGGQAARRPAARPAEGGAATAAAPATAPPLGSWKQRPAKAAAQPAQAAAPVMDVERERKLFMSSKAGRVHEAARVPPAAAAAASAGGGDDADEMGLTPDDFQRLLLEVERFGAGSLDKRAAKQYRKRMLDRLGAKAEKGPRTAASIGKGVAKVAAKREARALEEAIETGMVQRKGLGKKKRALKEQQRDRGLMEAGPSFKNGVLRIKKNSVKKEKKIPYKMRLPSF